MNNKNTKEDDNMNGRYTSNIDKENFKEYVEVGLIISGIILLISSVSGLACLFMETAEFNHEHKIYRILHDEEVIWDDNNKSAIEQAQTFRLLYMNQYNFSQLNGLNSTEISEKSNLISSAMNNWNVRVKYTENPDIPFPENNAFDDVLGFLIELALILFLFVPSIIYLTREKDYKNRWWQYPWSNWWAYPAALCLISYIVLIQPFVLIYAIGNETIYIIFRKKKNISTSRDQNAIALEQGQKIKQSEYVRSDELIQQERSAFDALVESTKANKDKAKENFANIGKAILNGKKQQLTEEIDEIKRKIEEVKQKLSRSGNEIQEYQRSIGKKNGEIKEIEKSLEEKNRPEAAEEFEKILGIPMVRAVDVENALIRIYTETINIEHDGKIYEIGDAIIKLDVYGNDVRISIIGGTSRGRDHPHSLSRNSEFCFGDYSSDIYNHISSGNYYQATLIILHSLQTIEVAKWGERMNRWKKVKEQEVK